MPNLTVGQPIHKRAMALQFPAGSASGGEITNKINMFHFPEA
jgi:hypothetical protein